MFFSEKELDQLQTNSFVLDGIQITLTNRGDPRHVYRGSGFLKQTNNGELEYRIYNQNRVLDHPSIFGSGEGSIVPDSLSYDLELTDVDGRIWLGERTIPSTNLGANGTIISGKIFEIYHSHAASDDDHSFWSFLPGLIDIPTNNGIRTTEESPGRQSWRFNPNIWNFEDDDYKMIVKKSDRGIELDLQSLAHPLPEFFEMRLEESLWFTLAIAVRAQISEKNSGGQSIIRIRERRVSDRGPGVWAPLRPNHGENANHSGKLLLLYLKYVLQYSEIRYHPISATILRNINADASSINLSALAVSTSIESLIEREFSGLKDPKDEEVQKIEAILAHIRTWNDDDHLRDRVVSSISGWKGASVSNAMNALVALGVIGTNHLKAWKTLRNKLAHGSEISLEPNELVQLCATNYVCWLRLMLHLLRYSGPFSDYSAEGWIQTDFPSRGEGEI